MTSSGLTNVSDVDQEMKAMSPPAVLKPARTSSLPYRSFKNWAAQASGLSVW